MKTWMWLAPLAPAAVLLAGCPTEECEDDTGTDVDECCEDDTATEEDECAAVDTDETDVPADPSASVTLLANGADIETMDWPEGVVGFWFGWAETENPSGGWFGEDCILDTDNDSGTGDYIDYGYEICHYFTTAEASLVAPTNADGDDNLAEDIVESVSTLLDQDYNPTYLLAFDHGDDTVDCYVWGEDVAYYASEGCTEVEW